ncbi:MULTISPECIES: DUF397 domain-containing protein [unclassified Nocardiopsis]|uniref:DUF397 domain-containing protein n=1 Tax=Nocardiopsis TaxID=2013 RepID=UPI00387B854E
MKATWFKSSYSESGSQCVEARMWHKSSYSDTGSQCVEVSEGVTTGVRDTQHRELGHLEFAAAEWTALVDLVKQQA